MKLFKFMNPKFRIKQIGDKYFPQKKVLFWRYIRVRKCMIGLEGIMYPDDERYRVFSNCMPDVKKFIDDYRNFYFHPFFVKNHLIKTYYDPHHKKFYYIDTNTKPYLYCDYSEGICEKVLLLKDNIKKQKRVIIHNYE